jgi:hypothetical protein
MFSKIAAMRAYFSSNSSKCMQKCQPEIFINWVLFTADSTLSWISLFLFSSLGSERPVFESLQVWGAG